MKFQIEQTGLRDLQIITRGAHNDSRGTFSRLYSNELIDELGFTSGIAQINLSHTLIKGTVRGLHYQAMPYSETKVVACVRGSVWDVAVDIRESSPTFLKWHAEEISSSNKKMMLIPMGFAHGFQTLTDDVELIYLHSQDYVPHMERSINVHDPKLSIRWPLDVANLSERDLNSKFINYDFKG